jgi:hypothetical protein
LIFVQAPLGAGAMPAGAEAEATAEAEGAAEGELDAIWLALGAGEVSPLEADGEPPATEQPAIRPASASAAPALLIRPSLV